MLKKLPRTVSVSTSNGSWFPDRDPSKIGPENFCEMQNLRYTDSHPIGVFGYRSIVSGLPADNLVYDNAGEIVTTNAGENVYVA